MEIEDFEFDLSDVAAFESVATEAQQEHQLQLLQQVPPPQPLPTSPTPAETAPITSQIANTTNNASALLAHTELTDEQPNLTSLKPHQPPPQQTNAPTTAGQQPSNKILLVPINSSSGGFKHLFQLTGQRQSIIQLAPLQAASIPANVTATTTTTANMYLTATSAAAAASSSNTITTYNHCSPSTHKNNNQTLTISSVINKSLASHIHNNNSSNFPSPSLSSRNVSFNESMRAPIVNPTLPNELPKRKPCNCTKSQCLKLYCDCFANGEFCSDCNCTNCYNSLSKEKERSKAISQCLERNPEAFRPKIGKAVKTSMGEPTPEAIERRHTKGCNCKRSGCLKNYCECYEAKILCSNLCKCCGCKNYEESFERKSLMQLANSTSEHARGILKNLLPTNHTSNTGKEYTRSFITDKVIRASLICLLQSAQQAEKDGTPDSNIPNLIQIEMGKCLRMIVDSATESSSPKKR